MDKDISTRSLLSAYEHICEALQCVYRARNRITEANAYELGIPTQVFGHLVCVSTELRRHKTALREELIGKRQQEVR